MSALDQPADAGFHVGELAVQQRAGVRREAARLSRMLGPARLSDGIAGFLAGCTFLVITGRDRNGRLWTSPVTGPRGFLEVTSGTGLAVHAVIPVADPLHGLRPGQKLGMTAVEFAARRRVRLNGTLTVSADGLLAVEIEQAYGNCPQHIRPRLLEPAPDPAGGPRVARRGTALSEKDTRLVRAADTMFLGTVHPGRGADASHRGGPAGFVRVAGPARLWWPDYQGNNLFNSLGNLTVDPEAALLFLDFEDGRTLQLSGTAEAEWDHAAEPGNDGGTGRRVVFTIQRLATRELAAREIALGTGPLATPPIWRETKRLSASFRYSQR